MGTPLWYNFKQSPHVQHPHQDIIALSHKWFKNVHISMGLSLLEKAELILQRPPGKDSNKWKLYNQPGHWPSG